MIGTNHSIQYVTASMGKSDMEHGGSELDGVSLRIRVRGAQSQSSSRPESVHVSDMGRQHCMVLNC